MERELTLQFLNILSENILLYNENQRLYHENMQSYNTNIELFNKIISELYGGIFSHTEPRNINPEPSLFPDILSSNPLPIRPVRHNNNNNRNNRLLNLPNRRVTERYDETEHTISNNDPRTILTNLLNTGSRRNEIIESSIILFDISLSDLFPTTTTPPTNNGLTQEQINRELETIQYKANLFTEQRCPISLEYFIENEEIIKIKKCLHIFKKRNILRWVQNNNVCPMCRCNLLDD
jgi:hypothetical protein